MKYHAFLKIFKFFIIFIIAVRIRQYFFQGHWLQNATYLVSIIKQLDSMVSRKSRICRKLNHLQCFRVIELPTPKKIGSGN